MRILLAQIKVPGYSPIQAPSGVPTLTTTSFGSIFSWALGIAVAAGVMAAIVFFIYGGFKWITSGGDKTKLDSARKTIIFTIVGLVLIVLSLAIVNIIGTIFGVHYF